MTRIAVPCDNGQVSAHFGHAPEIRFFNIENGSIASEESLTPPPHEPGVLPAWIAEQGATVVLAGGMGGRAVQLFEQHGIAVVTGVSVMDAKTAVESHLHGTLTAAQNACNHGANPCPGH